MIIVVFTSCFIWSSGSFSAFCTKNFKEIKVVNILLAKAFGSLSTTGGNLTKCKCPLIDENHSNIRSVDYVPIVLKKKEKEKIKTNQKIKKRRRRKKRKKEAEGTIKMEVKAHKTEKSSFLVFHVFYVLLLFHVFYVLLV